MVRLIGGAETLRDGDVELDLIPVHGGETDDGIFIHDKKHGLLFVGDAFMPWIGAPFVAEGSPRGYLDSIPTVTGLHPRRLIHGHPPLTDHFTRQEWAAALDLLGGGSGDAFARVVDNLSSRGDTPMALRLVDLGFVRHPDERLPLHRLFRVGGAGIGPSPTFGARRTRTGEGVCWRLA